LTCIIIGVAAGSYAQATSGAVTQSFTLTLTGKGYGKAHHPYPVSMTLTGIRDRKLMMVVSLWVKGGNVNVQNYGTFAVSSGYGVLVQKCHYIWMSIKMTGQYYGGHTAVWHLCGKTGALSGNNLPVSFFAYKVILPLRGSPKLYDLTLTGTLTLN
jgi:hypothetical protein